MTSEELKKKRKKVDMSQFKLSIKSKVSRFNISLFESGYKTLTPEELGRIKNTLATSSKKRSTHHAKSKKSQPVKTR